MSFCGHAPYPDRTSVCKSYLKEFQLVTMRDGGVEIRVLHRFNPGELY